MNKIIFIFILLINTNISYGEVNKIRDPTQPLSFVNEYEDKNYHLTGIIIKDNIKAAVINGKILHIGDEINEGRLVGINLKNVLILSKDKNIKLELISK